MAETSKNGKYLRAVFSVWYDPSNDNVHLTTNDKDFGPNGCHVSIKKGTASDRNSRIALVTHGCPPGEPTEAQRRMADARAALVKCAPDEIHQVLDSL